MNEQIATGMRTVSCELLHTVVNPSVTLLGCWGHRSCYLVHGDTSVLEPGQHNACIVPTWERCGGNHFDVFLKTVLWHWSKAYGICFVFNLETWI